MKKLVTLIAILALCIAPNTFAMGGGEGDNTHCNGQGNPNSPCAGNTNNGGNGGNGGNVVIKDNTTKSTSKASVKNNVKNTAKANNEGVNVDASDNSSTNVEGDEYYNVNPPATTPMVGTVSAQVTSMFGGVGYSKDAKYMIIKFKMDEIETAVKRGFITQEEGIEIGTKLFKKFIKANNGNPIK